MPADTPPSSRLANRVKKLVEAAVSSLAAVTPALRGNHASGTAVRFLPAAVFVVASDHPRDGDEPLIDRDTEIT